MTAVHNDLPTNDWNTLIQLMASKESYIENKSDKVFSYSAGRDMRSRVFADGSLTFGWGSIAQHWLSEAPPIKGAIIHTLLPPSEELIRLARKDWRRYLECRSKELAVGGQLVHVEMACNDAGLMGNENVWRKTNEVMRRAFGTEAVEHVVAPMYVRTQAEWREPFCNPDLGLALADGELIRGVPDPKVSEYLKTKDADAFVDGFMGMYRAALAPSLALDKRFTTEQVDKFHKMLEQELRADPVAWAMEWNIMVMRITRIC